MEGPPERSHQVPKPPLRTLSFPEDRHWLSKLPKASYEKDPWGKGPHRPGGRLVHVRRVGVGVGSVTKVVTGVKERRHLRTRTVFPKTPVSRKSIKVRLGSLRSLGYCYRGPLKREPPKKENSTVSSFSGREESGVPTPSPTTWRRTVGKGPENLGNYFGNGKECIHGPPTTLSPVSTKVLKT